MICKGMLRRIRRWAVLSALGATGLQPMTANIITPIGPNTLLFPEETRFETPWVDDEDVFFSGMDGSGEPNRPEMRWLLRYPMNPPGGMVLMVPEAATNFVERYLRPSYIFSEVDPPNISDLELDGDPLTIGSAIRLALTRNMEVQIVQMETEIQDALVWQSRAEFDPVFETSIGFESLARPQNTQEFISSGGNPVLDPGTGTGEPRKFEDENQRYGLGFQGKMPSGLTYELEAQFDVIDNTLVRTSEANVFDPEYSTRFGLSLTQPLLRNASDEVNLSPIRVAQKNRELSELEFEAVTLRVVSEIIKNYYDLTFSYNEIRLRRLEVETLQLLVEQRREQVELGLVSVRQIREILAQLAESTDNLLLAEQRFNEKRQEILRAISSAGDADHNRNFVPRGQMPTVVPELDEDTIISRALERRVDYRRAMKELELDEIEIAFARNQSQAELNLVGTAGLNGLGETHYDALERSVGEPYADFTIALVYSRPWNNSRAKARVLELRRRRMQTVMELRQIEHITAFEVRKAVETLRQQELRLKTAIEIRRYFEEEVEEEQLLLEKGDRSIYDTLQFYSDLSDARIRELSIINDLNKSIIDLRVAEGTLLEELGITFLNR